MVDIYGWIQDPSAQEGKVAVNRSGGAHAMTYMHAWSMVGVKKIKREGQEYQKEAKQ